MDPQKFAAGLLSYIEQHIKQPSELESPALRSWLASSLQVWNELHTHSVELQLATFPEKFPEEMLLSALESSSGIIHPGNSEDGFVYILYKIIGLETFLPKEIDQLSIFAALSVDGLGDLSPPTSIPGWKKRHIQPRQFVRTNALHTYTEEASLSPVPCQCLVLRLPMAEICAPKTAWSKASSAAWFEDGVQARRQAFGIDAKQNLTIKLTLAYATTPIAITTFTIEVGHLQTAYFMQTLQTHIYQNLILTSLFDTLSETELRHIVSTAHPITLNPFEPIIRQRELGSSLFVVLQGDLEAFVQNEAKIGHETLVGTINKGSTFGEMSFLTGAPRSASVYAGPQGAMVLEIKKEGYQKILKDHPELIVTLAKTMRQHLLETKLHEQSLAEPLSLAQKIKAFFFPPAD